MLGIFLNSGDKPKREKRKEKSLCPHAAYSLVGEMEDKTQIKEPLSQKNINKK